MKVAFIDNFFTRSLRSGFDLEEILLTEEQSKTKCLD
jgi:hypothetical protein